MDHQDGEIPLENAPRSVHGAEMSLEVAIDGVKPATDSPAPGPARDVRLGRHRDVAGLPTDAEWLASAATFSDAHATRPVALSLREFFDGFGAGRAVRGDNPASRR